MEIIVKNINKKIKNRKILSNISLHLESGTVYGFVGRNGSGKTMLFRALAGLMKVDSGEIIINNKVLHKDIIVPDSIGLVLENAGLYPEFTGRKNLQILAKLQNIVSDKEIDNAIRRVGLDPNDKRIYRKYSLGMKQRIVIAQAIMEKPKILMLDEPTNALDESGVQEIREIVREEKNRGALILIASHNKDDIKLLADKVFYMNSGRLSEMEI